MRQLAPVTMMYLCSAVANRACRGLIQYQFRAWEYIILPMQNTYKGLLTSHDVVQATAQLHAEHHKETSALQRAVDHLTALVGWPGFVAVLAVTIFLWVVANNLAGSMGFRSLDPSPFIWLQGAISTGALFMAALILTTQRRKDQLASHREQLVLELAILNDQKVSKIIELLEESRRDNPMITNRIDDQARAMSTPTDSHSVLEAIKEVQSELE